MPAGQLINGPQSALNLPGVSRGQAGVGAGVGATRHAEPSGFTVRGATHTLQLRCPTSSWY